MTGRWQRYARWLLVAGVLAGSTPRARAAEPVLTPWLPAESFAGGKQADARLERTVRFWGAGIRLAEVFGKIEEQTGVHVGFDPPGDVNARVCVNLYLNPERPPLLRDLLVQLAWVTDCAFATEGEGEGRRYFLLSTSLGGGVFEQLRAIDPDQDLTERVMREATALHPVAVATLPELRGALKLSREEVIRKYKGQNDNLLFTLLDPTSRAGARLICSLTDEEVDSFRPARGFDRLFEDWSPAQQAIIQELLRALFADVASDTIADAPEVEVHPEDSVWIAQFQLRVNVGAFGHGGFRVQLLPRMDRLRDYRGRLTAIGNAMSFSLLDNSYGPLDVWDAVRLRKLLGERMTKEQEEQIRSEASVRDEEARERKELLARISHDRRLTPEALSALDKVAVSAPTDKHALWQFQELAAARTGRHIVSDCFWQPERRLEPVLSRLAAPGAGSTVLSVLTAACTGSSDRWVLREAPEWGVSPTRYPAHVTAVNWEWGDAGDFLRFRSTDRDVWRAAFLPEATLAALDAVMDPAVAKRPKGAKEVAVAIDPRQWANLLASLTVEQERWGGSLIYGDPTDPKNGYRHALREQLGISRGSSPLSHYRLVAHLTDAQWRQLQAQGLVWGKDVSLKPAGEEARAMPIYPLRDGDVLRLQGPEDWPDPPVARLQRLSVKGTPAGWPPRGQMYWLILKLRLVPKRTDSLVTTPAERAGQ